MFTPGLPAGGVTTAATTPSEAGQYIAPQVGTVTGTTAVPTAMATTAQAAPAQEKQAAQMQAATAAPARYLGLKRNRTLKLRPTLNQTAPTQVAEYGSLNRNHITGSVQEFGRWPPFWPVS